MRPTVRVAAFAAVLVLIVTACGDGAVGGPGEEITVTAIDYEFVDLPDTVKAGTIFGLQNDSEAELHELVAVRLPDDETRSPEELVQLPEEELGALFPDVDTVVIALPGEAGFPVVGTGALTEPGRYVIVCAIPTGADPAAYLEAAQTSEGPPAVEGGPPHFLNGMYAEVEVVE